MRALVTGGAGFIGHHLVRRLVDDGCEVRVLDNFATGSRERLEGLDVELVEGDLRSYERAHTAIRGTDVVFHLGALPSVPRSVQDPLTTGAVNVEGTLNVLLAARDESVRRVVFASSSSVYGLNQSVPKAETDQPLPISPYGVSKLAAEHYCRAFTAVYGLETVSLRLFNVFGPGQDPLSQYAAVIPRFIVALTSRSRPTVYGDGTQSRDFTYVDDVTRGILRLIDHVPRGGEGGTAPARIYNVGNNRPEDLMHVVAVLEQALGREAAKEMLPMQPGDVVETFADIGDLVRDVGFAPQTSIEDGIRDFVAWYRGHYKV